MVQTTALAEAHTESTTTANTNHDQDAMDYIGRVTFVDYALASLHNPHSIASLQYQQYSNTAQDKNKNSNIDTSNDNKDDDDGANLASATNKSNVPNGIINGETSTGNYSQNINKDQHHSSFPLHLRDVCRDLYKILESMHKTNVAVWLQGPRGSGKSMVAYHVLKQLQQQQQQQSSILDDASKPSRRFRIVYLHGILSPSSANNVVSVLQDALRQLSMYARNDCVSNTWKNNSNNNNNVSRPGRKFSSIHSASIADTVHPLSTLNDVLQIAKIDNIPVLFVLDDLEAYVPDNSSISTVLSSKGNINNNNDAHVFLYFLLDRVATPGTLLSVLGLTSVQGWKQTLEKRVASRADGTGRTLHMPKLSVIINKEIDNVCFCWRDIVEHHLQTMQILQQLDVETNKKLRDEILLVFDCKTENDFKDGDNDSDSFAIRVYKTLQRNFDMGKSAAWLCRVLALALACYRYDLVQWQKQIKQRRLQQYPNTINATDQELTTSHSCPPFIVSYWWNALVQIGDASILSDKDTCDPVILISTEATINPKRARVDAEGHGALLVVDPRLQVLADLSGPQTALVFAVRRILKRDTQKQQTNVPSLTLDRILAEYSLYRGATNKYNAAIMQNACYDLMEVGLLQPAQNHVGTLPLQYYNTNARRTQWNTLLTQPLQFTVDIHRELDKAIEHKLLQCSTALQEWGQKLS